MADRLLHRGPTHRRARAITDFVAAVTEEGGDRYVPPAERIATFDNDGTLWCEKPIPIQLDFTMHRMAEQATDSTLTAESFATRGAAALHRLVESPRER